MVPGTIAAYCPDLEFLTLSPLLVCHGGEQNSDVLILDILTRDSIKLETIKVAEPNLNLTRLTVTELCTERGWLNVILDPGFRAEP